MNSLEKVTDLTISGNQSLNSLNGLNNLATISSGNLMIRNNPALASIAELSNVSSLNTIEIDSNNALMNLTGLENITSLQSLPSKGMTH
ncbi:MAG: hypothetical protein R3B93_11290 [Bacteroidia bacterium]